MVALIKSVHVLALLMLVTFVSLQVQALSCWQCGEYNDGVGSITPCLNNSKIRLMACPRDSDRYCIKYVSQLSVVRDCVPSCTEKEMWRAYSFCCDTDGCNSAVFIQPSILMPFPLFLSIISTVFV